MLYDGLTLTEGSAINNLTVAAGTADPANPNAGELFYRTDTGNLRIYNGTIWADISAGGVAGVSAVAGTANQITVVSSANGVVTLSIPDTVRIGADGGTTQAVLTTGTGLSLSIAPATGTGVSGANLSLMGGQSTRSGGPVNITGAPENLSGFGGGAVNITGGQGVNAGAGYAGSVVISGGIGALQQGTLALRTAGTERLLIGGDGSWKVSGALGTVGQVLTSNGSSVPTWQAVAAPTGAGSDSQVTFNNAGSPYGSSYFTWNNTSTTLVLGKPNGTTTIQGADTSFQFILKGPTNPQPGQETISIIGGGTGYSGLVGGDVNIMGRNGLGSATPGGDANVFGGHSADAQSGSVNIISGGGGRSPGAVRISGKSVSDINDVASPPAMGGSVNITAGNSATTSPGANVVISGGGGSGSAVGGLVIIQGGPKQGANAGGAVLIRTSTSTAYVDRFRITNTGAWAVGVNPTTYGTAGQVLTSNANAAPTWQTAAGGVIGADTQISFNTAGAQSGSAAFTWNDTTAVLSIGKVGVATLATLAAATTGSSFTIKAPNNPGFQDLNLMGGGTGADGNTGGAVTITGKHALGTGTATSGGAVNLQAGDSYNQQAGSVNIYAGYGGAGNGIPGNIVMGAGNVSNSSAANSLAGGTVTISAGNSSSNIVGGNVTISAGGSGTSTGGAVILRGGPNLATNAGGDVLIQTATAAATAYVDRLRITSTGAWAIGATNTTYGTTGQVLTSTGNAAPTWQTLATGGVIGTDTQISFNKVGVQSGSSTFTWGDTSGILSIGRAGSTYLTTLTGGASGVPFTMKGASGAGTGSQDVTIIGGGSGSSGLTGGAVNLTGLSGTSGTNGGAINLQAGDSSGQQGGSVNIYAGYGTVGGTPGNIVVGAGNASSGNIAGGAISLSGGNASGTAVGGTVTIAGGGSGSAAGGNLILRGGPNLAANTGGDVLIQTATLASTTYVDRLRITTTGAWNLAGTYGTSGQVLTSNANAAPTWQATSSVAIGADTQIAFNKAGVQSGSSTFTWGDTAGVLSIGRAGSAYLTTFTGAASGAPFIIKGAAGTGTGSQNVSIIGGGTGTSGIIGGGVNLNGVTGTSGTSGGAINLQAGDSSGQVAGAMNIYAGYATSGGTPGNVVIGAGNVSGGAVVGGAVTISAGNGSTTALGGAVTISGGGSGSAAGGAVILRGGPNLASNPGGDVLIQTATSASTAYVDRLRITSTGAWAVGATNTTYGTSGQILTSTGNAAPTWQTAAASAVVGTDTQIAFNKAGVQSGSSTFTWNDTSGILSIGRAGSAYLTTLTGGAAGVPFIMKGASGTGTGSQDVTIIGGGSGSSGIIGGAVNLTGLSGTSSTVGGAINLQGGDSYNQQAGAVNIYAGYGGAGSGIPGNVVIGAGNASAGATAGGAISITGGNGSGASLGGAVTISGGTSASQTSGAVILRGGSGAAGGFGGDVLLQTTATGSGTYIDRLRITTTGAWAVGATNTTYGTSGQVLTSTGNTAPTWQAIPPASTLANFTTYGTVVDTAQTMTGMAGTTNNSNSFTIQAGANTASSPGSMNIVGANKGGNVFVQGGTNTTASGGGGYAYLQGGNATGTTSVGGSVTLTAGTGTSGSGGITLTIPNNGAGTPNNMTFQLGSYQGSGAFTGATFNMASGGTSSSTLAAASVNISGGVQNGSATAGAATTGGAINITGGAGSNTAGSPGGPVTITGGASTNGLGYYGGTVLVQGGSVTASSAAGNGGLLQLYGGNAAMTGPTASTGGNVDIRAGRSFATGGDIVFGTATSITNVERFRITTTGAWSVGTGGAAYGTAGQVLMSNGNAVPTWSSAANEVNTTVTQAATTTLNLSLGSTFSIAMTSNITTLTLSNPPPASNAYTAKLYLTQDATGSRTVTWPASVKWAGGVAPTLTTTPNKLDIISLTTRDAGTSYTGLVIGLNF